MLKNKLFKIINIICFVFSIFIINAHANNINNNMLRQKILNNKYIVQENIECSPEEIISENRQLFKKSVKITRKYTNIKNNEFLCDLDMNVIFTYDKKNFVEIQSPEKDLIVTKNSGKWRIRDCAEILPENKSCDILNKFVGLKNVKLGTKIGDYFVSGHMLISCDISGNITVNTDLNSEHNINSNCDNLNFSEYKNIYKNQVTHDISDKLRKKEEIYVSKFKNNKNQDNKLLRVTRLVTYKELGDNPNKKCEVINVSKTESNFRYNTRTKTASCLSTHGENLDAKNNLYNSNLYTRTANTSPFIGHGYSGLKLKAFGGTVDDDSCEMVCDNKGEISFVYHG